MDGEKQAETQGEPTVRDGPRINVDLGRGDFVRHSDPAKKYRCPVCEAQCAPPKRGEYIICPSCRCTWW